MGNLSRWKCFHCGDDVIEGQRFTFIPGKGPIHVECLNEILLGKPTRNRVALAEANEALLYVIVRLKSAERMASDTELKQYIASIRKEIEKQASTIANKLSLYME